MSATKAGVRPKCVKPLVGVVEGRKLSTLKFCIGHAAIDENFDECYCGVGLKPPPIAISESNTCKNNTDDACYDLDKGRALLQLVDAGITDWSTVTAQAGDDTTRLLLLDLSSTVQLGLRTFVDDTSQKLQAMDIPHMW